MAIVWTSTGKKSSSARAVGSAPVKLGQNVLWEEVDDPTDQDVTLNRWPVGTVVYRVSQA